MSPNLRALAGAVAAALLAGFPGSAPAQVPGDLVRPQLNLVRPQLSVSFDWEMPERFRDVNGNGLIDVPNTPEYVRGETPRSCPTSPPDGSPTFCVALNASYKALDPELASLIQSQPQGMQTTYRWHVSRPGQAAAVAEVTTSRPSWVVPLEEGRYRVQVDLTLRVATTVVETSSSREIQVDDILIVSMGDSLSSGEGNPEHASVPLRPSAHPAHISRGLDAVWADDGKPFFSTRVSKDHHRSHRSAVSWPAQAALAVESADPRTSVTFVHVAASGAKVRNESGQSEKGGLIENYDGIEDVFGQSPMEPQLDQVARLLDCVQNTTSGRRFRASGCDRQIDALTISIGANDIGFSEVVKKLLFADMLLRLAPTGHPGIDAYRAATGMGSYYDDVNNAIRYASERLAHLPLKYDELATQVRTKLDVFRTYLMEYPDPTGDLDDGEPVYCDEIVGDVMPPLLEMSTYEQKRAEKEVMEPLNKAVAAAAARHGWRRVGGIAEEFGLKGHGYCAPASRKWVRTAAESARMQGPGAPCFLLPSASPGAQYACDVVWLRQGTKGTLHPDARGHRFMADSLRSALVLQSKNTAAPWHENDDQLAEAVGIPVTQPAEKDHCEYAGAHPCALFNTDVDMYRVTISGRNQRMTFRAEARAPGLKPQLRLFDAAGTDITKSATCVGVSSSAECPAQVSSFTLTFREPGTYYVGVSAWGNDRYDPVSGLGDRPGTSANLYSLRVFTVSGVPDNTLAHPTPVSLDERVEGYAVETWADVDMFRFHAGSAGDVHVDVKSSVRGSAPSGLPGLPVAVVVLQPGRFSARLFDRTGNELARGEEPFTHRLPSAGDYYLGIASPDATYDPTVGVAQPAGQGRPPGGYVLALTRGSSAPEKDPEPAPAPIEPEEPPDEDEDRTVPPRPEVRPNEPPSVRDGYVKLPRASCVRICVWHIWLEPGDVVDPEGDDWAVHSWNHSRRLASLSFGECGYDEHGCFRYSTLLTGPYEDSFTFRVWDQAGSGRPSEKATVTLCVNCR